MATAWGQTGTGRTGRHRQDRQTQAAAQPHAPAPLVFCKRRRVLQGWGGGGGRRGQTGGDWEVLGSS